MPGTRRMHARTRECAAVMAHARLGIDTAAGAIGGRIHGAGLVEALATGIAVDTAGAGIDQAPHPRASSQRLQQLARARIAYCPARRRCEVQHRVGQRRQPAERSTHRPGHPAVATRRPRAGMRRASATRSAPTRASAAATRRSTRRPMSPQPTISNTGRRARDGGNIDGNGRPRVSGHNSAQCRSLDRLSVPHMTFKVSVQPAGLTFDVARDEAILPAAIRSGVGLPYGCRDGACGSCKSRLIEGPRASRRAPGQGLVGGRGAGRLDPDLLRHAANRLRDRGPHRGRRRRVPAAEDARARGRARAPAPDVIVMKLQLPATVAFKYRAGQYVEFILRDGVRRSYSMATAPEHLGSPPAIELHLRHMPGGKFTDHVFGAMKEKDILRLEGPFGSFFLREDSRQADRAAGLGHRLRADQGHRRTPARARASRDRPCCTGAAAARPICTSTTGRWQAAAAMPHLRYVPVLSEATARRRLARPHRPRAPGRDGRPARPVGPRGLCLRRAGDGRRRRERDFVARCGLPEEAFYADSFTSEADKHGA